jgi:hypothetical protein
VKEPEENPAEEEGISNRRFHSNFIPPLTPVVMYSWTPSVNGAKLKKERAKCRTRKGRNPNPSKSPQSKSG